MAAVCPDDLAALDFFAGNSTEDLQPLAAQLQPLTAAPGEILMRQGEHGVVPADRFRAGPGQPHRR
ncbi:hypothetical protein MDOR_30130 [Mycolicibacterium doricum]|uniref:Uncharacterized protein n=1 Tax=Mycolicibacterium doricum TaxID=126673 RepID=A0A7I7VU80_9MYCO|nr:hypothetical protein MDOR_30130 [Mycolicibacterium doricum]